LVAAAAALVPAPALPPFTHPCLCLPLLFACWCLSFIRVPAPVCTHPPAHRSCLFMPTWLRAFVWPTQPTCLHPLTLAPFVCAHRLLLAPALAHTSPVACASPRLFSVSHLPPPPLLLLPLGLCVCPLSAYFPSVCLLVPARLCPFLLPLSSSLLLPSWAITWYLYQIHS
jgi:hypothetical protein